MSGIQIGAFGERAIELRPAESLDERSGLTWARSVARTIEACRIRGDATWIVDVVAAYGIVVVHVANGPIRASMERLAAIVADSSARVSSVDRAPKEHEIAVIYDGVDLASVAAELGMRPRDVAELHTARVYEVELLGFLPGFAYLGELDPRLVVGRLATPRPRIDANSVAIAGARTAVYPAASPGGWRVLGRAVSVVAFDPARDVPALFCAGDRVRFEIADVG